MSRPWQGWHDTPVREIVARYDKDCYMCPGNSRASGDQNPRYSGVFAFDNDFPALSADKIKASESRSELFRSSPEHGACRVLCFSPRHDMSVSKMDVECIEDVIYSWCKEYEILSGREDIGYVQIFENRGAIMGASNPHPHSQIWAVSAVPSLPERKGQQFAKYYRDHECSLLERYLREELEFEERIVFENSDWVVLVPYWAVWPFETMVLPRRAVSALPELTLLERKTLALLLKELTVCYDRLFDVAFPYSMGWYNSPTDVGSYPGWGLHASYYPPLLRSATIRKFIVGYELSAEGQRDFTPEHAAKTLRGSK